MPWRLAMSRLPAEPSRHRVAAWRELRKVGAVSLQPATWAVPTGAAFDAALERTAAIVDRADGQLLVFQVAADDPATATLEQLYSDEREAEWNEFLAECTKFDDAVAHAIAIQQVTPAEPDAEEDNPDR